MNDLSLTYGGIDYLDRLPPLLDGTVKPAGISLRIVPFIDPWDLFRRVVRHSCVFRTKSATCSGANRPPIPAQSGHRSGANRPPLGLT
jgi:hypothetical protein